ncbi:MAG TPA: hypothetical protein VFB12_15670 [Ktedonobacteraceae bacterium]|nr:hypothetical protein [Ktedonobacteraceae bacterium]
MTARRLVTNNEIGYSSAAIEEAIKIVSANVMIRRWVWVCEVCGMMHLGKVPDACDCCGATHALEFQEDTTSGNR